MTLKISSDNIQSSGVSAGSYTNANITVNEAGQITSASNGVAGSGGSGGSGGTGTFFTYTYTGDGTTTTFAGGSGMTVHNVIIAENGVVQYPTTDYTVSGSNIVFTTAPASGVLVQIRILAGGGGSGTPKITSIAVTDSSYNNLDDTAVNISGGYIKIAGTDFAAGCQVVVGSQVATSVTFISSTEVRAQVPAQTAGTYTVYLTNSDGGVAIRVNALNYSATPTWTTTSPLPGSVKNTAISLQLAATSNSSVTYTLQAGSTLPSGLTLSSGGLLSGTTPNISSETTYNFTIVATDAEAQDTPQAFQITIVVNDPYYPLVTLHLPGNGTNLANNNTFLDGSTNNFTITRNGNTTQGTFSPFSQTGWGNFATATSASVGFSCTTASLVGQTASTFTAECWIYMTEAPVSGDGVPSLIGMDAAYNSSIYLGFGPNASRVLVLRWFDGASKTVTGSTTLALNTWYHVAVVANSNALAMYVNGNLETLSGTTTLTNRDGTTTDFSLLLNSSPSNYQFRGYVSNIRVCTSAVYTTSFTPSTLPLTPTSQGATNCQLLTAQDNRFIDKSSNGYLLVAQGSPSVVAFSPFNPTASWSAATNGGSGYFDGNGDYLTAPSNAAFAVGSVFTIEFWLYPISAGANPVYIYLNETTGSLQFGLNSGNLGVAASGLAWRLVGSKGPVTNAWNHCVLVRSGTGANQTSIFLNGERIANGTVTDAWTTDVQAIIQSSLGTSYQTNGYMSGVRIVKGTAVYDPTQTTLTVPTAPLTAITNTSLLLNFTNAGIYDATSKNDLETVGNAQISTAISAKWGSGSMYFDGTGDYLAIPSSQFNLFAFNTGDFTLEAWIYPTALSGDDVIISSYYFWATSVNFYFGTRSGSPNVLLFRAGDSVPISILGNTAVNLNEWCHVAVTRSSGVTRMFVNGVTQTAAHTGSVNISGTIAPIFVGANNNVGEFWTGYMQDVRVTKGYARYTSNFTPPTAAFPAQ